MLTSISDYTMENEIKVYPNPAKKNSTLKIQNYNSPVTFEIIDVNGRVVYTQLIKSSEAKISLSVLKSGVYMYRLSNQNEILKQDKIIIQ